MKTLLLSKPTAAWTSVLAILPISMVLGADVPKPPQTETKPVTPPLTADAPKAPSKEELDASIKERQAKISELEKKIEELEKKREIWARERAKSGKLNVNDLKENAAEQRLKSERHSADKVEKHAQEADAKADALLKGAPATPVTTDKAAPKKE